MIGYKAFRLDAKEQLRFLFHTHGGSSLVPMDCWLSTKRPWVTDGSRQKKYRSGFHFLQDKNDIIQFQKLTKGKYIIVPVQVQGIERKPRTNVGSWLACKIRVPSAEVNFARQLHELALEESQQSIRRKR
jgi:hypothetical protein